MIQEVRKRMDVPLHYPLFKVRHHDPGRQPGGYQVHFSTWNQVEDGCVDMAHGTGALRWNSAIFGFAWI
jgi:hypothetical protein